MGRGDWLLRYRFLFDSVLVVSSVAASALRTRWVVGLLAVLLVVSVALTWVTYKRTQIQPKSDSLRTLLESEVLPRLHDNCNRVHPGGIPDLRINVMFLRWRGINPWRNDFLVKPWERTLCIEASYTTSPSPDYGPEAALEWRMDQGVVGDGMNERAQEVWTRARYPDVDPRVNWNLSQTQYERTAHVGSVLSVPIYLPSDENKVNPVGVLNLDSNENVERSKLDDERIRDEAIYWGNVVGAIVE